MAVTLEDLKKQLEATERDLEVAKANVYRCDGVMQLLKHLIATFDKATPEDPTATPLKES